MSQTRERHKEYMRETKDERLKRKHKRKEELRTLINNIKTESGCKYCSEKEPVCLVFHHRNSKEKDGNVGEMVRLTKNKKLILEEIEKCDILCANCHRKLHWGRLR